MTSSFNRVMNMSIAVGVGLMELPFSGAKDYWRWVDLCEAGGVDSLWQTDRLLSREPMLECMTAMAALAGRTRRIKFGMNVVSLALRDPVLVAKQCATIDVLSEGRLLPAFGIGSPRAPEWAALHVDAQRDYALARQRYLENSQAASRATAKTVEDSLRAIYENVRTLTYLPSVQNLDRHGTNLGKEGRATIDRVSVDAFENVSQDRSGDHGIEDNGNFRGFHFAPAQAPQGTLGRDLADFFR